jgi:hypothetical protein
MRRPVGIESLVGETLTYIDIDDDEGKIMLTTESGRQFMIHHYQDCCEVVRMESTEGDWDALIGKVIEIATHEEEEGPERQYSDHVTETTLTFKVDGATIISRWIGESNGYYSESVDIEELPMKGSDGE